MATRNEAEFDQFADDYDASIGPGVSWSGEPKEYYARARIAWLGRHLQGYDFRPRTVLDFGCGTGAATPFLLELLGAESVIGVDNSAKSLEVARRDHGSERARFQLLDDYQPAGEVDLVYCNGVFHHIPPADRAGAVQYIYQSLKPGGFFGLWENNPWNPVGQLLMALAPVDRTAIKLSPPATRRLVRANGFEVLRTDFLFLFPKRLRWLRSKEHLIARWPLGLQYEVLCRRKVASGDGAGPQERQSV